MSLRMAYAGGAVAVLLSIGTGAFAQISQPIQSITPVKTHFTGITFGTPSSAPLIYLFDGGVSQRFGIGMNNGELQMFNPAGAHFTWNTGSDLQPSGSHELMRLTENGALGIGTTNPQSQLHIVATPPDPTALNTGGFLVPSPNNHVLTVENMSTTGNGNGIAIIIHNPAGGDPISDGAKNDNHSNYVTFYNDNGDNTHIKGRIEGFSYQNYLDLYNAITGIVSPLDLINPLNYVQFNLGFDPNFLTFNPNFIHITPPTLPSLSGGSLPNLTISNWHLGMPKFIPDINVPYPSGFDPGSFPSLSGGSPGNITFDAPVVLNGSPITGLSNPVSLNHSFLDPIVTRLRGLPYKDKAVEIVANPVAAAVKFGSSFLSGITYESGSGDYAEWLERADHNEKINIADVVAVKGGKITKNTEGANQFMVASWKPCVLGNMPDSGKEQFFHKVAFMGQVPVKMFSSVKKGDYIVPDGRNNGFAKAVAPEDMTADQLDRVLGVAWDDDSTYGVKIVKIAVGLKPHEMVKVIQDQAREIDVLKAKVKEIDQLKMEVAQIKTMVNILHPAHYTSRSRKHIKNQLSSN